jgi:hypothetical protein
LLLTTSGNYIDFKVENLKTMKNGLILFISLLVIGSSLGQMATDSGHILSAMDDIQHQSMQSTPMHNFDFAQIIFIETFDSSLWHIATTPDLISIPENMPNGWTAVDETENNFYWRWSLTGPRGRYTSGSGADAFIPNNFQRVNSTSNNSPGGEKGFIMLESDFYNTTAEGQMTNPTISMDSYIQSRAINCSANTAVNIYFEQWHRFCCSSYSNSAGPKLLVSNDGASWTQISVHQSSVNQTPKVNPTIFELSLTVFDAGQATVYLRWHHKGQSHYHWSIDDIVLYQPLAFDVRLNNYWVDYSREKFSTYNNSNVYKLFSSVPYFTPYHALQPFLSARSLVTNFGELPMTDVKITTSFTKAINGSEVASFTSAPLPTSIPGATDSIESAFTYQMPRTPETVGAYTISGIVHANEEDMVFGNNVYTYNFNVTENLFGYANPATAASDRVTPFAYLGPPYASIGVVFMLNPLEETLPGTTTPRPYILRGANVFISDDVYNWLLWRTGLVPSFQAEVWGGTYDFSAGLQLDGYTPIIASGPIPVDSTFAGKYLYLPFPQNGQNELLTPNQEGQTYLVSIKMNTGGMRFHIGADKITHPSFFGCFVSYGETEWGWTTLQANAAIELIADKWGENITGGVHFEILNENPTTGITTGALGANLAFFASDPNNPEIMVEHHHSVDLHGVVEITGLRSGSYAYAVEYQGESKAGRFAVTGSQMSTVRHLFSYTAVQTEPLVEDLILYPNPTNGRLTLSNVNNARRIQISNILGQIIEVICFPESNQTIDVSHYASGVYIMNVLFDNGRVKTGMLVKNM